MIRRPPRSTRTDTLFPYTTLFRSTVELKDDADPWDDVKATVEVLRGKANVSVSARTGTLTAWGPPADVDRIARYVEVLNDIYSRQVVLTVELVRSSEERRLGKGCVSTCRSRVSPSH